MDILYEFYPFVFCGASGEGRYCESLPLKTPPSSLLSTHGRLFGMVCVRYPDVFPLDDACRSVLPFLESLYYERDCYSPHRHLVFALTETQAFLEKRILEINGVDSVDFSVIAGCVWGSVLYVARCGGMCALRIYRDTSFGVLFDIARSSGSSGVVSLSGFIQPDDVVVLYSAGVAVHTLPLYVHSLGLLSPPLVYDQLSELFHIVSPSQTGECVSGFYIASVSVPSVDDEQIAFIDTSFSDSGSDFEKSVALGEHTRARVSFETDSSYVFRRLIATPASVLNFVSRLRSHLPFSHISFFSRVKSVFAFFTRLRVFILGCIFLLLFFGFIIIGKPYEDTFKQEKQRVVQKTEFLPQIREDYSQAQYYAELNPERAKWYLRKAQDTLARFGDAVRGDSELAQWAQSLQELYSIITKTYIFDSLVPFFDLKTINQQASAQFLSLVGSDLILSDTVQHSVYVVDFTRRSARVVIGRDDISRLVGADGHSSVVYAVGSDGIVRTNSTRDQVTRLMGAGSEWGNLVDVDVFGANVYVLDTLRHQVWKYVPDGSGFGPVRHYVSSDESVNFSRAVSLSIDGHVWVGFSDGSIMKFLSGRKEPFSLAVLDDPLVSLRSIFTSELSDFLYVLDSNRGRVVVFLKKNGSYVSTYQSDTFTSCSDVTVDVRGQQMFVLCQNLIYRIELRESGIKQE